MSNPSRIYVLGARADADHPVLSLLRSQFELVPAEVSDRPLSGIDAEETAAVCVVGDHLSGAPLWPSLEALLRQLPEGVAALDSSFAVLWANDQLARMLGKASVAPGLPFLESLGNAEILGPDFAPLHTALGAGEASRSTVRVGEKTYFELHAAPVFLKRTGDAEMLVVTVRDISQDVLHRQKLNAIHQAGMELGDLSPDDILEMSVDDRVELLKQKIVHFTNEVLEFETVEVRLLDRHTKQLEPLLNVGMTDEAAGRKLKAEPTGNGVTGFVAATGKSYLCDDTSRDSLYLPGAPNARSSMTVPLVLHDEVLGTFNVESAQPGAFTEEDLQFLELFSRDVAIALNTLELLAAEKVSTATESTTLILREVARPMDEILNDTTWILDRYIGHDPAVAERLQRILKHTRGIRQLIHKVGETISPRSMQKSVQAGPQRMRLRNKRILVVDSDETVRQAAHEHLGRFGCEVETAHNGEEALLMVRISQYDAVIADIRLPDMTGFDCFLRLREMSEHLPVIFMTGFGYDPHHSIVKARQAGLKSVLYKPFRLDQLLKEVEAAVGVPSDDSAGRPGA